MSEAIFNAVGTSSNIIMLGQPNTKYTKDFNNFNSTQLTWGGGASSHAFTIAGLTSQSVIVLSLANSSNGATIKTYSLSNNTLTLNFSGDPGTNTIIHAMYTLVPEPIVG